MLYVLSLRDENLNEIERLNDVHNNAYCGMGLKFLTKIRI